MNGSQNFVAVSFFLVRDFAMEICWLMCLIAG